LIRTARFTGKEANNDILPTAVLEYYFYMDSEIVKVRKEHGENK
jgi:hypothetical protein